MQVISVIDDDASVRSATIDLLDSAGLNCRAFASAEEYLSSGWAERTSCLVLDVSMPGLTGIELQRKLVQFGYTIPVIFITAFPKERLRAETAGFEAICCLLKPYSERELLGCIRRALAARPENLGSG
jgi:FixJ family two-component response regulator